MKTAATLPSIMEDTRQTQASALRAVPILMRRERSP
jgi:hypothetical protein